MTLKQSKRRRILTEIIEVISLSKYEIAVLVLGGIIFFMLGTYFGFVFFYLTGK